MTEVIIVGGGAGGMSCAITMASAWQKPWFDNRRIMIIDDKRSDLNKAMLNNAPGVPLGTTGTQLLEQLQDQLAQYPPAKRHEATVLNVRRHPTGGFEVELDDGTTHHCLVLVLATGYKRWDLDGLDLEPAVHPRGGKSNRLMLSHDGCYLIEPDMHVAGLLAGGSSQFAIAAGIGAQVAVDILSDWAGKRTHVHEVTDT